MLHYIAYYTFKDLLYFKKESYWSYESWRVIAYIFSRLSWFTSHSLYEGRWNSVTTEFNQKYIFMMLSWYSPSLLWCQKHLGPLWYPDRQQVLWGLTGKKRTRTSGLVTLTFSPGRPLSPTTPGSVTPGRPYIIHSDVSSKLCIISNKILLIWILKMP